MGELVCSPPKNMGGARVLSPYKHGGGGELVCSRPEHMGGTRVLSNILLAKCYTWSPNVDITSACISHRTQTKSNLHSFCWYIF